MNGFEPLFFIAFFLLICFVIAKMRRLPPSPGNNNGRRHAPKDSFTRSRPEENVLEPPPTGVVITGRAFVIDGDSIRIAGTEIRLFGIDAPELGHPHGRISKSAMIRLCRGQEVRAEIQCRDVHGRTVARCFLPDGRDLSAELVKLGLAIDWPKHSGGIYRSLEPIEVRQKLWLADARQKGRMDVWARFNKGSHHSQ